MTKVKIRCPNCGRPPERIATEHGLKLRCCGLWAWGLHPLADAATHEARRAAHAAFDRLWKGGPLERGEAYRRLAEALGLTREECHMKLMDEATARRVVEISPKLHAEAFLP